MDVRYRSLILLGISLPYIIQFYYVDYYRFIFYLMDTVLGVSLYSFSALMAILTIFALVNRVIKGPGSLQDSLIITTLTTPVVFPSLIMLVLLITSLGDSSPSRYFGAAADLYLVGIAALVIVLPILGIIVQWIGMIRSRGSPFSHILYTMIIFSLMNFVAFSMATGETINQQLIQHGANIVINAIFVFQVIVANIIQSELPMAPASLNSFSSFIWAIPINTIFALSSALYIYIRLFGRHTIDKVSMDGNNLETFLNINNLGRISITFIFAILLNFVLIFGMSTIIESVGNVIKTVNLLIVSSFVFIILFYSYQWRKEI